MVLWLNLGMILRGLRADYLRINNELSLSIHEEEPDMLKIT